MNHNEYLTEAKRTCPSLGTTQLDNLHMVTGVASEFLGELPIVLENNDIMGICDEVGDHYWYLANYCRINGLMFTAYPNKPVANINECIGELVDIHKKNLAYGKEINWKSAEKHVQSIVYHLNHLLSKYGISIEECLQKNIDKLRVRFPDKFDAERAINKNADDEKQKVYEQI